MNIIKFKLHIKFLNGNKKQKEGKNQYRKILRTLILILIFNLFFILFVPILRIYQNITNDLYCIFMDVIQIYTFLVLGAIPIYLKIKKSNSKIKPESENLSESEIMEVEVCLWLIKSKDFQT